jgi:hypothetical protein
MNERVALFATKSRIGHVDVPLVVLHLRGIGVDGEVGLMLADNHVIVPMEHRVRNVGPIGAKVGPLPEGFVPRLDSVLIWSDGEGTVAYLLRRVIVGMGTEGDAAQEQGGAR